MLKTMATDLAVAPVVVTLPAPPEPPQTTCSAMYIEPEPLEAVPGLELLDGAVASSRELAAGAGKVAPVLVQTPPVKLYWLRLPTEVTMLEQSAAAVEPATLPGVE